MRRRHIAAQREGVLVDFAGFGTAANPGSWRTPAVVVCPCSGSFLTGFTETAPGGAAPLPFSSDCLTEQSEMSGGGAHVRQTPCVRELRSQSRRSRLASTCWSARQRRH